MDVYHTLMNKTKQNVAIFQKKIFKSINVYYNAWVYDDDENACKKKSENADILENTKNVYVNQENVDQDAENHQDVRNVDVT